MDFYNNKEAMIMKFRSCFASVCLMAVSVEAQARHNNYDLEQTLLDRARVNYMYS